MNFITGIIEGIKKWVNQNRNLFIIVAVLFLGLFSLTAFLKIRKSRIERMPIKSIEVTCNHEFKINTKLSDNFEYFEAVAIRENGAKTTLDVSKLELSQDYVNPYGKTTVIEAKYTDADDNVFTCNVEIPNEREKIVGFQCGYPNAADVVAVLYSNGELSFEGEGDTLVFHEGDYPWMRDWWTEADIEEEEATKIMSVTFDKGVKPTNLNYAFENCTSLVYIDKIPSSVRTMVRTFAGCTELKNGADVSDASVLLNMNYTYEGCEKLVNANVIPQNVRVSKGTFKDCIKLQLCANMSKAENLVIIDDMYSNCQELTSVTLIDGITSMKYAFAGCINLKQVFNFPTTVKHMQGTFSGDVSLSKFDAIIPETVQELEECFKGCELLAGELYIFCNVQNFKDMFLDACQATKINLVGNSMLLDAYANTSNTDNVYVNNYKPNTSIVEYKDIFDTKQ